MAQTKKTNTKGKKAKDVEILSDFHCDFMTDNGATVTLDLYDNGDDKHDRIKLTIADAFVIYCTAVIVNKKKDSYAFISYPSFYSENKEQYYNQAFCFEKELIKEMNDALNFYYFE